MEASDGEVIVRPRDSRPAPALGPGLAFMLVAWTAFALARVLAGPLPTGLWAFAIVGPFALVGRSFYFVRTSIRITATEVETRSYFGRTGRCARASIAQIVAVDSAYTSWASTGSYSGRRLYFLDAAGRTLLRPSVAYYPPDEMVRLQLALRGIPWWDGKEALERARTAGAVAAAYETHEIPPGALHDLEPFPPPSPQPGSADRH